MHSTGSPSSSSPQEILVAGGGGGPASFGPVDPLELEVDEPPELDVDEPPELEVDEPELEVEEPLELDAWSPEDDDDAVGSVPLVFVAGANSSVSLAPLQATTAPKRADEESKRRSFMEPRHSPAPSIFHLIERNLSVSEPGASTTFAVFVSEIAHGS